MKNKFSALIFFALLLAIIISLFVMLSKHAKGADGKISVGEKELAAPAYLQLKSNLKTSLSDGALTKSESIDLKGIINAEKNVKGQIEIKNFNGKLTDVLSAILQK
jgi:hypothetical protein